MNRCARPRDYKALAHKIKQLAENEDQRKSFGEEVNRTAAARADWEKCIARMEAIYKDLM